MTDEPPPIDLPSRRHSHLYELKPISRWWLAPGIGGAILGVAANGWNNPGTWCLLVSGAMIAAAVVLTNPKKWLSKLDT